MGALKNENTKMCTSPLTARSSSNSRTRRAGVSINTTQVNPLTRITSALANQAVAWAVTENRPISSGMGKAGKVILFQTQHQLAGGPFRLAEGGVSARRTAILSGGRSFLTVPHTISRLTRS